MLLRFSQLDFSGNAESEQHLREGVERGIRIFSIEDARDRFPLPSHPLRQFFFGDVQVFAHRIKRVEQLDLPAHLLISGSDLWILQSLLPALLVAIH